MLNKNITLNSLKFFKKKIFIPQIISVHFFIIKHSIIFLLTNSLSNYYCVLPKNVDIMVNQKFIYLSFVKNKFPIKSLYSFLVHLAINIRLLVKPRSITFLIRGVGLKFKLLDNPLTLQLKVGYSHLIFLKVINEIKISIFKKKIIISCFNKITLGNFSTLLYKYRPINIFTGKGLLKRKSGFKLKSYTKQIWNLLLV